MLGCDSIGLGVRGIIFGRCGIGENWDFRFLFLVIWVILVGFFSFN